MHRKDLEQYIFDNMSCDSDYPWLRFPNYEVFRHKDNKKWFAIIMDIPRSKLGIKENGIIDVVNFKCDKIIMGSLLNEPGIFPAYHMNKSNWITVALDGSVSDDTVIRLLGLSYDITAPKLKKNIPDISR